MGGHDRYDDCPATPLGITPFQQDSNNEENGCRLLAYRPGGDRPVHVVPRVEWEPDTPYDAEKVRNVHVFFGIYFCMTGLHGLFVLVGALAYVAVFVLLSLLSSHALIIGLIYAFLWEGALSGIFEGLRFLSIRHFVLGIAGSIGDTNPDVFDAYLGGETALALLLVTILGALLLANRKLAEVEVREAS